MTPTTGRRRLSPAESPPWTQVGPGTGRAGGQGSCGVLPLPVMAEPGDLSMGRRPARGGGRTQGAEHRGAGRAPLGSQALIRSPATDKTETLAGRPTGRGAASSQADGSCLALCQALRRGRRGRRLPGVGMDWPQNPRWAERRAHLENKHGRGRRWGDGTEPSLAENGKGASSWHRAPPTEGAHGVLCGRFGCTRCPVLGPLWGVRVRVHAHACVHAGAAGWERVLGLLCPPTSPSRYVWLCKALTSLHQGHISGEGASPSRLLTAS